MRGFVTIDNQPRSDTAAVWVTTQVGPHRAGHTNAVCVDKLSDPDASRKLRSLTRDYAVLLTEGSTLDALPIDGKPLSVADIEALVTETEDHQERITAAVGEYASTTTRSKSLASPTFLPSPVPRDFAPQEDTVTARALQAANYVARAWTLWLATEEQRWRRTVQPRTNKTPWIMPDALNAPAVAAFPPEFAARVHAQPLR
jgi:hypothetical protein